MGKRLCAKTKVNAKAMAKHVGVTKADGSQRVLCTCSNFTAPSCGSCKQRPYDFDKDLLPKQVVVAWKTYNPCRVCSGERASGSECYGCWATRRKRKDKNQQAVIDQLDAGGDDTDTITSQRRGYVSGNLRYMQLPTGGSSSKSVNENTGIRREEVVEAFFYKIADWLRVMNVSADVMATLQSKRSMVAYARKELNAVVVLDDRGEPGVEESQLPQGASHKVRRLNFHRKEIGDHTAYDDEDEDLAHEHYAGMRLVGVDRAVADEDDDFAGTAPALPSSANRAVASVALGKNPSMTILTPRSGQARPPLRSRYRRINHRLLRFQEPMSRLFRDCFVRFPATVQVAERRWLLLRGITASTDATQTS